MNINKIISKLPILLVGNSIFVFLFLKNTEFYAEHYYTLDKIDSVLVLISLIHCFFFSKVYSSIEINFILCILAIVFLTFFYYFINEDIYYYLYILIITITIIKSYVDRNRKISKN